MTRLDVLTFNLQRGLTMFGRSTSEAELAAAFSGINADVVALQEVDRAQPRSRGVDQAHVVAQAMGLPYVRFAATLVGDLRLGKSSPATWGEHEGPGYGLAIASRYPITAWFVRAVPRAPFRLPNVNRRRVSFRDDEQRGALAAVIDAPGGPVSVCSTHLSTLAPIGAVQLPRVLRSMAAMPGPAIVCGDLNMDLWAVRRIARGFASARAATFPAGAPRRQIDHILVHGATVSAANAHRLTISDHRALKATVELG